MGKKKMDKVKKMELTLAIVGLAIQTLQLALSILVLLS